jgi:hypothetical protein
LTKLKAQV